MPLNRILAVSIAVLTVFLLGSTADAQRPKRVGIVVTVRVNITPEEARELAADMGSAIREALAVDVISGVETDRRLPEGGIPDECVARVACRNDIGRRLDADELLMLVVLRLGEDIHVDSTWANVASGDTASRPKVVISPGDDRTRVFAEAVPTILPHIEKPTSTPPPRQNIIVVPPQVDAEEGLSVPLGSWIAGAVGVASLVGGTVFAVSARQKFDALDSDGCRDVVCEQGRIESLDRRALGADVLFGVSGAAAATAVVLYLIRPSPSSESDESPIAGLRFGPGTFGLAIGGDL